MKLSGIPARWLCDMFDYFVWVRCGRSADSNNQFHKLAVRQSLLSTTLSRQNHVMMTCTDLVAFIQRGVTYQSQDSVAELLDRRCLTACGFSQPLIVELESKGITKMSLNAAAG